MEKIDLDVNIILLLKYTNQLIENLEDAKQKFLFKLNEEMGLFGLENSKPIQNLFDTYITNFKNINFSIKSMCNLDRLHLENIIKVLEEIKNGK